jgi:hypothetical protein
MRLAPAFLIAVLAAASLAAQAPPAIDDVGWLQGCWRMTRPDGFTEEFWLPPAGGAMIGISRTVRGGRMTEYEFATVRVLEGKLAYDVKPSGQPQTVFPLAKVSPTEIVFENAAHDFPQRVIYRKTADGITGRIEGTLNGQSRSVDFPYRRCQTTPTFAPG